MCISSISEQLPVVIGFGAIPYRFVAIGAMLLTSSCQ